MDAKALVALAAVAVVVLVAAYEGEHVVSRQTDPGRVTVTYWEKWTGGEGQAMQKVVNDFNRSQNRIFVKYLSISGVDSKTLLATAGGDPPDIAGIWHDRLPQFADANALTDLMPMAQAAGLTSSYYIPAYWNELVDHGKLYALPSTPASIALHVATDLVPPDMATPESFPKTIEGLDALAEKVTVRDKDGALKVSGFMPSDPGWWNFAWGPLFGGSLMKDGKFTLNSPENVRAFTWIASYAKRFGAKDVQSFQSGFGNFASPQDPFMVGKVATELNGTWKGNYINMYHPGMKWFAVPFPYPADRPDLAGHTIIQQDVLSLPRGAKHPNEAFEFIRYVQRQDVMENLCISHGKNSPLAKVSENFFKCHPNPYIRLFDQLARSDRTITSPKVGIWTQVGDEINVAFQEVNTLEKTPQQALDDAQARVEREWETYQQQVLNR